MGGIYALGAYIQGFMVYIYTHTHHKTPYISPPCTHAVLNFIIISFT